MMRIRNLISVKRRDHFTLLRIGRLYIYLARHAMQTIKFEKAARRKKRRRLKGEALDRAGHRCEICGRDIDWLTMSLHHIKPRLYYPELEFDPDNLQALCAECHRQLHAEESLRAQGLMPAPSETNLPEPWDR